MNGKSTALKLLAWTLLLLSLPIAARATVLPDSLGGYVMRASESPYETADLQILVVPPGDTLRIEAGVVILCEPATRFVVQGCLLSEGRMDSLVVFTAPTDTSGIWFGLRFEQVESQPQLTSRLRYTHVNRASTGVLQYFSDRIDIEDPNLVVDRCLFTRNNQALLFYSPVVIRNSVFENSRTSDIQNLFTQGSVRNCVFLPNEDFPYRYSVVVNHQLAHADLDMEYNCFHAGEDNSLINFLYYEFDPTLTPSFYPGELSATNVTVDPRFLPDEPYHPDPDLSPLVDAGDPEIFDPDFTRSDIGLFWAGGELLPLAVTGELDVDAWVVGYDYRGSVPMTGYPPPVWEILDAPPGLVVEQLNRSAMSLRWDAVDQLPGQHRVRAAGVNDVDGVLHRDTLDVNLDLQANRPPEVVEFVPCPSGDCLGSHRIVIDGTAAGDSLSFHLKLGDPDADRLGARQSYTLSMFSGGRLLTTTLQDSLDWELRLDTLTVDYLLRFDDGLLADSLELVVEPRFSRLSGAVSGVLGQSTGSVYFDGPVWVEEGEELLIEAGTRIISSNPSPGEFVFNVEGRLLAEGDAEAPIVFRSLAEHDDHSFDDRPYWLRLGPTSDVDLLAHLRFDGMGLALSVEYRESALPLRLEDCEFIRTRTGVLAVGSAVDLRRCVFQAPHDSLQLGSYCVYLAESQGSLVRNCLFRNPIVGVAVVDAAATIANNSFVAERLPRPGSPSILDWPLASMRGFGRVTVIDGTADLTGNLFHWKTDYGSGGSFTNDSSSAVLLRDRLLESTQRAVWLDEESVVRMRYNWVDIHDGLVMRSDSSRIFFDLHRALTVNDSLRLTENVGNQHGPARYDASEGWRLFADSPLVNASDPAAVWNDGFDGSRGDIGWTGGPLASEADYSGESTGPIVEPLPIPSTLTLLPAWPNPFNPSTRLAVELSRPGRLELSVHNLLGQRVATLADARLEPGRYEFHFEAGHLASGAYFVRARQGDEVRTAKILLIR